MRENRFFSNKSLVAIKVSLFIALLIGLVVYTISIVPIHADDVHLGCKDGVKYPPESICDDGYDNDCDGLYDCDDPDCHGKTGPGGVTCCQDDSVCPKDTCKDTGDEYGGGICTEDDNFCDLETHTCDLEIIEYRDFCCDVPYPEREDHPGVHYYYCYCNTECRDAITTEDDSCSKEGTSCEASNWVCLDDPGKLTETQTDGTDDCDGDMIHPYYKCTANDGTEVDTCAEDTPIDCNEYDDDNWVYNMCDPDLGDIFRWYEDWTCEYGECVYSGYNWHNGYEDCEDSCTDTDDGVDYFTAGTVTDYELCTDEEGSCPYDTYSDECGVCNVLTEYYCDANDYAYIERDCDDFDCSTPESFECIGAETDEIYEEGDDYYCSDGACRVDGKMMCNGPWVCGSEDYPECSHQDCGSEENTEYVCYYSNSGDWTWDTSAESVETACHDGKDNDCDGYVDCEDPDCDQTPPVTEKDYGSPHFPLEINEGNYPHWITTHTEVILTSSDPEDPTTGCYREDVKVFWRNTLVHDYYCHNHTICQQAEGSGEWNEYVEAFTKEGEQESCHLIEYYAVDTLKEPNKETTHKQCVFIDDTGPQPDKKVDEPKAEWNGKNAYFYADETVHCWDGTEDEIECWRVTNHTSINMGCEDRPLEHPVNHDKICFKVGWDGMDVTGDYCNDYLEEPYYGYMTENGYCCLETVLEEFYFKEDTEHNLKYYCVDALGNKGDEDEEKFKVGGTSFDITLNRKWNLISVPFNLLNGDPEVVFNEVKDKVLVVLTYDVDDCGPTGWCGYIPKTDGGTIDEIKPGWGYWVLTNEATTLTVAGILMSEGEGPMPSRSLEEGWNLIGYYGTDSKTSYDGPFGDSKIAFCVLHSLSYPTYKWSALHSYWNSDIELDECEKMYPGAGYWIGMNQPDSNYFQSTVCTGKPEYC